MKRFFFLSFLCLLMIAARQSSGETLSGDVENFGKDYDGLNVAEDVEDDDELDEDDLDISSWASENGGRAVLNVDSFGAAGNGVSDDTQAFICAWEAACSAPDSVLLVPRGRRYLVKATRFRGPCKGRLVVQIDGTIVAPEEPKHWDPKNQNVWLVFSGLERVIFQGSGVIDGSGSKWWAASCKKNRSNPCRNAPTALTIHSSKIVRVRGLNIHNGQQIQFTISRSRVVRLYDIKVTAPGDSPNTDGIHITGSKNVALLGCKIATGDDCISIVNASSGIKMKKITCGPGHGISIGSLGKHNSIGIVTKVVLDGAFLHDTMNGLRIKTWQGGSGYVRGVKYQNVVMENVRNPIVIDQFYCDSRIPCRNQTSAVEVSEIVYHKIEGTTESKRAINFACSDTVPCRAIVLSAIDLRRKEGRAEAYCHSAQGFDYGFVHPPADCLHPQDHGSKAVGIGGHSEL